MSTTGELDNKSEAERIRALKKYDILDTPPDGSFDRLTRLASNLFDVPIAIVSLVDKDRIWFKSRYGLDVSQVDREPGLCASAILSDDIYLVEDAINDPRTLTNPLVASEFGLRFYAAAPLKTKEGYNLGTFCIIDKVPRELTEEQKEILEDLAATVMDQMELRLSARTAIYQKDKMIDMAVHDLKNPLTTITIYADLIRNAKDNPSKVDELGDQIKELSEKSSQIVNTFLDTAKTEESGEIQLQRTKFNFAGIVEQIVNTNQALAGNKNQQLHLNINNRPSVYADQRKLREVADNLINNAIKFSPKGKDITITVKEKNSKAILEVKDEGPGLTDKDKKQLFHRFSRLNAQPTGGEESTGLGLSIVKDLVEAHDGRVWAESDGKDKGSKFIVELPIAGN